MQGLFDGKELHLTIFWSPVSPASGSIGLAMIRKLCQYKKGHQEMTLSKILGLSMLFKLLCRGPLPLDMAC